MPCGSIRASSACPVTWHVSVQYQTHPRRGWRTGALYAPARNTVTRRGRGHAPLRPRHDYALIAGLWPSLDNIPAGRARRHRPAAAQRTARIPSALSWRRRLRRRQPYCTDLPVAKGCANAAPAYCALPPTRSPLAPARSGASPRCRRARCSCRSGAPGSGRAAPRRGRRTRRAGARSRPPCRPHRPRSGSPRRPGNRAARPGAGRRDRRRRPARARPARGTASPAARSPRSSGWRSRRAGRAGARSPAWRRAGGGR